MTIDPNPLLEIIPEQSLSLEQRAFKLGRWARELPLHRFVQEPPCLDEFGLTAARCKMNIWRENGSILCLDHFGFSESERHVQFDFKVGPWENHKSCAIFGKTDAAIAETATWFWSLQHPEHAEALLEVKYDSSPKVEDDDDCIPDRTLQFDFAALSAEQLAQILDANPTRRISLSTRVLTEAQGVVLATRSYPLNLKLESAYGDKGFQDGGRAFVEALEKRQSPFGSLELACDECMPLFRPNLKRLLNLNYIIDKLKICPLGEEMALLPFSAKVNSLEYKIDARYWPYFFCSLNIVANCLDLSICMEYYVRDADTLKLSEMLIELLNRVAELGHFKRFGFSFCHTTRNLDHYEKLQIVQSLISAIKGNSELSCLDLSGVDCLFDRFDNLSDIFQAMEEHKGLRTVIMSSFPPASCYTSVSNCDFYQYVGVEYYSLLERLLSRNRNIAVCDRQGEKFTDCWSSKDDEL